MREDEGDQTTSRASNTAKAKSQLALSWRNITVDLGGKTVLQPFSGHVPAGACLAVMGPSGSGKTTLLNALSRRGPLSGGEVQYGGRPW